MTYLLPLLAYFCGSVSSAVIVAKLMQLPDPRTIGSGNPGATNILRIGGKKAAAITLLGDFLKGFIPVLLTRLITDDPMIIALVMLGAFLGHLYPVFFAFKGGKGVATAFGAYVGLDPWLGLILLIIWIIMVVISRYSSASGLVTAACSPVIAYFNGLAKPIIVVNLVIAIILFYRHRDNIKRLLAGEESKVKFATPKTNADS